MAIAKDEIFGPVVSVLPFKSMRRDDRRAPTAPTTAWPRRIWTKDIDKAHLLRQATSRPARCG